MSDTRIISIVVFTGCLLFFIIILLLPLCLEVTHFRCVWAEVTGIPCLLCGLTTSCQFILRGNIKEALITNPLGIFLILGLGGILILSAISWQTGSFKCWRDVSWRMCFWLILLVISLTWLSKIV